MDKKCHERWIGYNFLLSAPWLFIRPKVLNNLMVKTGSPDREKILIWTRITFQMVCKEHSWFNSLNV